MSLLSGGHGRLCCERSKELQRRSCGTSNPCNALKGKTSSTRFAGENSSDQGVASTTCYTPGERWG
eukprot:5518890-Alexandrium_andersonii.AAC.1